MPFVWMTEHAGVLAWLLPFVSGGGCLLLPWEELCPLRCERYAQVEEKRPGWVDRCMRRTRQGEFWGALSASFVMVPLLGVQVRQWLQL